MGKFLTALIVSQSLTGNLSASWHDRKAEGWAWYEDKTKSEEVEKEERDQEPKSNVQILAEARAVLDEKLATATLYPTRKNLESYMTEQKIILDRAERFANIWQQVLLLNPSLDATKDLPVSQYGRQIYNKEQKEKKEGLIRSLSSSHGLFFFYSSNCPYSMAFSSIVKRFSDQYNWNVVAISIDGGELEEFPDFQVDNGVSKKFDVKGVPSLFAVNPETENAVPISYGMIALDKLEDNIFLQFGGEDNAN